MGGMKRKIPYGVMNWAEVVRECYFVDNTAYIRALEDVKTPVFLRPKRFGKSLWCSMLGYYYDVNFKDRFDALFGKTDIGRAPTPLANSFLVLKFDFSTIQIGTVREIEERFCANVRGMVGSFAVSYGHLADWSEAVAAETPSAMVDALRRIIADRRLPPLYVIVDEYDNFTNELVVSRRDVEYDAICGHDGDGPGRESFFKAFFKSFKAGLADGTVGRTYFTGVLPITLDDLSSGFNVGTVVNLNPDLLGMVGFTQAQVGGVPLPVQSRLSCQRHGREGDAVHGSFSGQGLGEVQVVGTQVQADVGGHAEGICELPCLSLCFHIESPVQPGFKCVQIQRFQIPVGREAQDDGTVGISLHK